MWVEEGGGGQLNISIEGKSILDNFLILDLYKITNKRPRDFRKLLRSAPRGLKLALFTLVLRKRMMAQGLQKIKKKKIKGESFFPHTVWNST